MASAERKSKYEPEHISWPDDKEMNPNIKQRVTLNNGVEMPMEGFGVFQITDPAQCEEVVLQAIDEGYRLFDTASAYHNEDAVGKAIRASGLPREELFIVTKGYVQQMGYERIRHAFEESLTKLGVEYLDLYLIHQPFGDYYGAWRGMEEILQEGRVRAIGVSNFYSSRLMDFCLNVSVIPAVNQLELHPFFQRTDELLLMKEYGIHAQAWSPFAEGLNGLFSNPVLETIAKRHNKSIAQVVLRWNIQRGVMVIPKSVHKKRIKENFAIWDFELSREDMDTIATLDIGHPLMLDPLDPKEVKRVFDYVRNPVLRSV